MSLLNIVVGEQLAWAAFDTQGKSIEDGPKYWRWSKAIPLVHANCLLCCRGERLFFAQAFLNLLGTNGFDDFDTIEARFPEVLNASLRDYIAYTKHLGVNISSVGNEICLLGWSETRGRPCLIASHRSPGATAFEINESRCRVAPAVESSLLGDLSTVPAMIRLAREQVASFRSQAPDEPIGGELIIAEITRAGMSFRKIADLG